MIPSEAEFVAALREVVGAFDRLGISYALGSSFASGIHGKARAKRDVDLIVNLAGRHAPMLAAILGPSFYADEVGLSRPP